MVANFLDIFRAEAYYYAAPTHLIKISFETPTPLRISKNNALSQNANIIMSYTHRSASLPSINPDNTPPSPPLSTFQPTTPGLQKERQTGSKARPRTPMQVSFRLYHHDWILSYSVAPITHIHSLRWSLKGMRLGIQHPLIKTNCIGRRIKEIKVL